MFNKAWHKAFYDKGDLFVKRKDHAPFPKGDNNEIAKNIDEIQNCY